MQGLIIKPGDGLIPFNTETVTDPTIEKAFRFRSFGTEYECKMKIPLYMWEALDSQDWDTAVALVENRIEEIRLAAAADGKLLPHQWGVNLENFAKTCVYNQFMKRQQERGNVEGHAVPTDFL